MLITLDDGECISLDANEQVRELITEYSEQMKGLAGTIEYQYILNMNYSKVAL